MSILLPLKPLPGIAEPLWLAAPERPNLPANELHIWRARLDEPQWNGEPGCPVSRERRDRLKAALFRKDILERYAGAEAEGTVGTGYPQVVREPFLRMAVAQCDHLALIAVSRDARGMGLDVERVRQDIPIEEMAGGFLDVRAQWDLRVTWSQQEKAWKFFQFWTSNEACAQVRPTSRSSRACHVRGFSPEADFVAALAVEGGAEAGVIYWDWHP